MPTQSKKEYYIMGSTTFEIIIAGSMFLIMLYAICFFAFKASILKKILQKNEEILILREEIDDIQKGYIEYLENKLKQEVSK